MITLNHNINYRARTPAGMLMQLKWHCKGGETGPAGQVLAGPLFHGCSKYFPVKNQMHG